MATWTPINDVVWSGKILTTSMWNTNFGVSGNMQYIKDAYVRYYQASTATMSIAQNTLTTMASYTIPTGWENGLYFISMNVEPSAVNELAADARRQVNIQVNSTVVATNNYLSVLSAGAIKPTYNLTHYRILNANDVIDYRFFQNSTAASFVLRASIHKVGI